MTTSSPAKTSASSRRDRGFVVLLLLTAGALMLLGQAVPSAGSIVPFALGLEVCGWALVARSSGLAVTGGLLTGVGAGVALAAMVLPGASPAAVGAAFLLSLAGGFTLVAVMSWGMHQPQHWAWVAAAGLGTIGAGLLGGPDTAAVVVGWALPVALVATAAVLALRGWRSR